MVSSPMRTLTRMRRSIANRAFRVIGLRGESMERAGDPYTVDENRGRFQSVLAIAYSNGKQISVNSSPGAVSFGLFKYSSKQGASAASLPDCTSHSP